MPGHPILTALDERETTIATSLSEAQKAREEIAKMTNDNQKLINEAKEERARIIKEAKELGEKLVAEAREKATVEYTKKVAETPARYRTRKLLLLLK